MRYKGALFAAAAALVVLPVLTPAAAQPVSPEAASQGNAGTVSKEWYTRHSADEAPYPLVSANTVLPGRAGLPPEAASQGNTGTVSKEWYTRHSADEAPYPLVSANAVLPGREGLPPSVSQMPGVKAAPYGGPRSQVWHCGLRTAFPVFQSHHRHLYGQQWPEVSVPLSRHQQKQGRPGPRLAGGTEAFGLDKGPRVAKFDEKF